MSWVTIIWSMTSAACLTLAGVHLLVWLRARNLWVNLLFCTSAVAAAAIAGFEVVLMRAQSTAQFGEALRWMQLPIWLIVVSLAWFIRLYLGVGRDWLLWLVCGLRTLALALNFVFTPNLNFRVITGLRQSPLLGETISIPIGVANPWTLVGQLSAILFLVYVVDASITAWRRGDRRRALMMGAALSLAIFLATGRGVLVIWGIMPVPYILSLVFLGIVVVMGYELSDDVVRAIQLSRELRESQERMSLAATAADLGLWDWDIVQDELWSTDPSHSRLGLGKADRVDFDRFLQSLHPDDREPTRQAVRSSLERGDKYEAEYRVISANGAQRWIAASGHAEFDGKGKPLRMRGVSIDITERKQAEEANRNLAHAQRLAVMGELTAMVAHEVNQPLGAILSNAEAAEMLLDSKNPPLDEIREILGDIRRDDLRADDAIRRIRALLRKREMQMEPLDLNETVSEVLRLAAGDVSRRHVEIRRKFARGLSLVLGDRGHLQQVLLNLIFNGMDAMKDTPEGARQLTVQTRSNSQGSVELAVTDCGCGIAPDRMPRLFESFFTTKKDGMGLGLSIARSIIEAHQGRIWAENNSGGGATFHITLLAVEPQRSEKTVVGNQLSVNSDEERDEM
jgi:two-component system, LuxR family, sensor kinase FixL